MKPKSISPQLIQALVEKHEKQSQIDLKALGTKALAELLQELRKKGVSDGALAIVAADVIGRARLRQAHRDLVYSMVEIEPMPKAAATVYYYEDDNDPSTK